MCRRASNEPFVYIQTTVAGLTKTARARETISARLRPSGLAVGTPRPPVQQHPGVRRQKDTTQLAGISLMGQQGLQLVGKPVVTTKPPQPSTTAAITPLADRRRDTRQQGRLYVKVRRPFSTNLTANFVK